MIIVLKQTATDADLDTLVQDIKGRGFGTHLSRGVERTIVGVIGAHDAEKPTVVEQIEAYPFVERVLPILKPYKLVAAEMNPDGTTPVKVGQVEVGGGMLAVMAGPCTVESEEQLLTAAQAVKAAGANILRGGAFKPSTSPYSFHGMGEDGLKLLSAAREATGLPIITEVMDTRDVELVCRYADCLQIGTRNMANYSLLRAVGETRLPVMLKRGMSARIDEWLQAAEYIVSAGNPNVILCERGIRTFETFTRNTFDLNAIPAVKQLSHLPVIADTAHGTGKWDLVTPVSLGAVAAGADGLMIEVHPQPEKALKDGAQSLTPELFADLMRRLRPVALAVGRCV